LKPTCPPILGVSVSAAPRGAVPRCRTKTTHGPGTDRRSRSDSAACRADDRRMGNSAKVVWREPSALRKRPSYSGRFLLQQQSGERAPGYLVSGRTVTIDAGVGRGSPLEKGIVAKAIKAATMRAKMARRNSQQSSAALALSAAWRLHFGSWATMVPRSVRDPLGAETKVRREKPYGRESSR